MGGIDDWSIELMTVISGRIGVASQATQVILMNMTEMSYMFAYGLQTSACTI
jgi:Na+-driven multidrug efflux pump